MTDRPPTRQDAERRARDRRRPRSLSDSLAAMSREQLVDEVMLMWAGWAHTQSSLYREIRELQERIHLQRREIDRLLHQKAELARLLKEGTP